MKNFFTLFSTFALALIINFSAYAQMAPNSVVPNFTSVDINGVEHTLYDYLDAGKTVIIDVSATWCGPCWGFHSTGTLETVYEMYGPDGTDEMMVFFVEGDNTTTLADLQGTGSNTQGDWVTGVDYPILDDGSLADLLEISYFPTIYAICPNRLITEVGQVSAAQMYAFAQDCPSGNDGLDAALLFYTGDANACSSADLSVFMQNTGTENILYANISATINGEEVASTTWTGDLNTWETDIVSLGSITLNQSSDVVFNIEVFGDEFSDNNTITQTLGALTSGTTEVTVKLQADQYGYETNWELRGSDGTLYASGGDYDANEFESVTTVLVPSDDCYEFSITDAYGDGICCAYGDGYYQVEDGFGNVLVSGGEFTNFAVGYFKVSDAGAAPINIVNIGATPQTNDGPGSAIVVVSGGNGEFEYVWTDAAGNVVGTTSQLNDLPAGDYTITITSGDQTATGTVTVLDLTSVGIEDVTGLTVGQSYPNPADQRATINLNGVSNGMLLNVVDVTGKVVISQTLNSGNSQVTVNTSNLANGTYFYQVTDANRVVNTSKLVVIH